VFGAYYKRYSRFAKTKFEAVSEEGWGELFRDLLEFEEMLAGSQKDIGLVPAHPFHLEYQGGIDRTAKPIYYPPPQRQWVKDQFRSLHARGLVRVS
jgi:hypothetical protein